MRRHDRGTHQRAGQLLGLLGAGALATGLAAGAGAGLAAGAGAATAAAAPGVAGAAAAAAPGLASLGAAAAPGIAGAASSVPGLAGAASTAPRLAGAAAALPGLGRGASAPALTGGGSGSMRGVGSLLGRFGGLVPPTGGGGGGARGGGVRPAQPGPTPNLPDDPTAGFMSRTTVAQATDPRGTNLGGDYAQTPRGGGGSGGGATSLRDVFAASAASAPSGSSLGGLPPQQGGGAAPGQQPAAPAPVTLRLKNNCASATLQALARLADASGGASTLGWFELKPGETVTAGATSGRTALVFAQEKGKGCGGGGRCWSGDAGSWHVNDDARQPKFNFGTVQLPEGAAREVTHSFDC